MWAKKNSMRIVIVKHTHTHTSRSIHPHCVARSIQSHDARDRITDRRHQTGRTRHNTASSKTPIRSLFLYMALLAASSSTASSGHKAPTWSPWSPHHHSLFTRSRTSSSISNISSLTSTPTTAHSSGQHNNNNTNCTSLMNLSHSWTTTTQPTRRASVMSSKSVDENCASHSKRPFTRTNTFSNGFPLLLSRPNESSLTLGRQPDDADASESTSSVEKSSSLENVSTQSNPSFWTCPRWTVGERPLVKSTYWLMSEIDLCVGRNCFNETILTATRWQKVLVNMSVH